MFNDFVFAGNHFAHIHFQACGADAVLAKVLGGVFVVFRALQQGFRRDAADIGASAAWGGLAGFVGRVDTGYAHAQLGGANGGDIATRAGADDDNIKILRHVYFAFI